MVRARGCRVQDLEIRVKSLRLEISRAADFKVRRGQSSNAVACVISDG